MNRSGIPARPTAAPRLNERARQHLGLAFHSGAAETYHRVRPNYPPEVLDFFAPSSLPAGYVAWDIAAGTGLFTRQLVRPGWSVTAIEPSASMLAVLQQQLPTVTTQCSRFEDIEMTDETLNTVDMITCAQAWHWLEQDTAHQLIEHLLVPGGILGVVNNQLDTSVPWVHRLTRIMHAGDVHPVDQPPHVGSRMSAPQGAWWHWEDTLTVAEIHELMSTRAYHLRASPAMRERMKNNLDWYLLEELGHRADHPIAVPYVTSAWRSQLVD